jgi:hypothetical protein
MNHRITNINTAKYTEGESQRGEATWRLLDLGGQHLGVRIEETPPGGTPTYHHYHNDVVSYPEGPVMLVKSARGAQQFNYEKRRQ